MKTAQKLMRIFAGGLTLFGLYLWLFGQSFWLWLLPLVLMVGGRFCVKGWQIFGLLLILMMLAIHQVRAYQTHTHQKSIQNQAGTWQQYGAL